ncbi:phosphatidylserine decarboxylase [bacterium]|nr:phosphatidylserine decarboxylase [bacterium]
MMKIRPESIIFFTPFLIFALIALKYNKPTAVICLLIVAFILYFFRDPERTLPENHENMIISPADGTIVLKRPVTPEEIEKFGVPENSMKLAIFMSVFSVHVNRAPISGEITKMYHQKGRKLPAYYEKSSEQNEHFDFVIKNDKTTINFRLIAGLIAQRIVAWKKPQDIVKAGERIGMIKFGSRVDIIIPPDFDVKVKIKDRVFAGESVLAEISKARS